MQFLNGFEIDKWNIHGLNENVKLNICPLCSSERKPQNQRKKVLMCDWTTGIATCQHCGEVIQLHTYKKKEVEKVYVKPSFKNNTDLSDNVVKWFEGRKISQFVLRRMKITEGKEWMPQTGKEVNTIQFNYFRDDELVNIKYRDGAKNFKLYKDAEKIFYNIDNIRTTKEAIIVEGEIDALSCIEAGFANVVSTPNGSTTGNVNLDYLDSSIEYFDNKEKIYLALDNDEPGQNVQKELIRRLGAEKCFLVDLSPCKDFNEVLTKEGANSVRERIKSAKECPLENVVTLKDFESELDNFYRSGMAKGFQTGIKSFDSIFSTYTGQYITVTGIPTHGKSEFVDSMCIGYNLKYGWKTAYCSPENQPEFLHADKLTRKILGYKPNSNQLNSGQYVKTKEHIKDNFYFINVDGNSLEDILDKGRELVKRKGIKCLVLDPFNKVTLKSSDRNNVTVYTTDYLNKIDQFCKKYDVLVILIAHPIKMRKINGVTPEPDFYDIKGGGEFYDMSYHGLLVHRDFENQTFKVKVLKVKFANLGKNQEEATFMYNVNNGRTSEISGSLSDGNQAPIWDNSFWLSENKDSQQELMPENIEDPLGGNYILDDAPF